MHLGHQAFTPLWRVYGNHGGGCGTSRITPSCDTRGLELYCDQSFMTYQVGVVPFILAMLRAASRGLRVWYVQSLAMVPPDVQILSRIQ